MRTITAAILTNTPANVPAVTPATMRAHRVITGAAPDGRAIAATLADTRTGYVVTVRGPDGAHRDGVWNIRAAAGGAWNVRAVVGHVGAHPVLDNATAARVATMGDAFAVIAARSRS